MLHACGQVLEDFDQLGGDALKIIDVLLPMCEVDETTVRTQAVRSIQRQVKQLDADTVASKIAPKVHKLMAYEHWWVPRVSGCCLFAHTYQKCLCANPETKCTLLDENGEEKETVNAAELGGLLADWFITFVGFTERGDNAEPMVRRQAALELGEAASACLGHDSAKGFREKLQDSFCHRLMATEQESIRCNALKCARHVFFEGTVNFTHNQPDNVTNAYLKCANDQSWRVRVAVVTSLPDVAKQVQRFGSYTRTGGAWSDSDEHKVIMDLYSSFLLQDNEDEVIKEAAYQAAAMTSIVDAAAAIEHFVPKLTAMVEDENRDGLVRSKVAAALIEMADPLGADRCASVFLGDDTLLNNLLNTDSSNTRLAVITRLAGVIDVLSTQSSREAITQVFDEIAKVCLDKNWRMRWAAMTLLPKLTKFLNKTEFCALFVSNSKIGTSLTEDRHILECDIFEAWSIDSCALIRTDFVKMCASCAEVYGADFLNVDKGPLAVVISAADTKEYTKRGTLLLAMSEWAPMLKGLTSSDGRPVLDEVLQPKAREMAKDRVPNLRFQAYESFAKLQSGGMLSDGAKKKLSEQVNSELSKTEKGEADSQVEQAMKDLAAALGDA